MTINRRTILKAGLGGVAAVVVGNKVVEKAVAKPLKHEYVLNTDYCRRCRYSAQEILEHKITDCIPA